MVLTPRLPLLRSPKMSSPVKTEDQIPQKRSFLDRYLAWFTRWMPESFVICLALTVFVGIFAYFATDAPVWSNDVETTSVVSA